MKKVLYRMIQSLLFILVSAWLVFSLLLYFFQPRFVYFPFSDLQATPSAAGLAFEDIWLEPKKGRKIHGWFVPHPQPRATLLFLHGNGGNISHRLDKLFLYHQLGLAVCIIDYPGYGQSDGKPSEQGTYNAAKAAWGFLTNNKAIPDNQIIIYGESLGGAVATWLASQVKAGALITESAFTSIKAMGNHYYPYLPVALLARIHYPTVNYIGKVQSPVLVIHSPQDEIVPYDQATELYNAANEPKSFLEISGDHNGGFYESGARYIEGLDQFIHTWFDQHR